MDEIFFPIIKINFIKMDIEGGEMEAIKGAERILKEDKPKLSIAVYHGYDNAYLCKNIIKSINQSYTVIYRGIYPFEGQMPRPAMLYAW